MKKFFIVLLAVVAVCGVPAFSAPKQSGVSAETSPTVWAKKAKTFDKKEVFTYVAEIGESGYATNQAPFVVVPIKTATEKNRENGEILVLIPFEAYEDFQPTYAPVLEDGKSTFGGKMQLKKISGVFTFYKKEPVLLVGLKINRLKNAPTPSEQLEKQLAAADKESGADKASRPGYTKKIFRVGAIGKNSKLKAEFSRLVSLYNKGKKSSEKMKPIQMLGELEDGNDPFTVFDEAKKIEWEIRL